jgi:Na+/phosphate symporter
MEEITGVCEKSAFESKSIADRWLEIKRKKFGSKFMELRSYKCEICHLWHHTSNMTPVYKKRIQELEQELKLKSELIEQLFELISKAVKRPKNKQYEEIKLLKDQLSSKELELETLKRNLTNALTKTT